MKDAELVEAVARKVLGMDAMIAQGDRVFWGYIDNDGIRRPRIFNPFEDANDLMMVLEKFDAVTIEYCRGLSSFVTLDDNNIVEADTLPRAVLEAALKAKEADHD